MSTAESQYFALLRAALWGTPFEIDGAIDWKAVMKTAGYQGNYMIIADLAVRLQGDNKPSDKMLVKMQNYLRGNLLRHLQLKQHLGRVVNLLREQGIEPVLLKGFGLARLYPNPSLRQFGDLDLFVGLDTFHEACALLRALPDAYTWCIEEDVGRHYNVEFGDIVFEIHRVSAEVLDPGEHKVYAVIEQDGLKEHSQRVDLDGLEILVPSKEFTVFFTFFHAWHHFLTAGLGWRQVSDVAMALHVYHGQLDLDKLSQWFVDMHLLKPWLAFGWLMVNTLGLPESEMPLYDARCKRTARKLYRRIMETGKVKRPRFFEAPSKKHRLLHKIYSFFKVFADFFYRARVFPAAAFREMKTSLRHALTRRRKAQNSN